MARCDPNWKHGPEERGPRQVQLLGWRPDIASLMAGSRLIVLPSHYEGMPNVILEAMAAGKPVVCSRVEGSQELLKHDWDQQSFPAGDGVQMARLASHYLEQQDLALKAGTRNQSFVSQNHALGRHGKSLPVPLSKNCLIADTSPTRGMFASQTSFHRLGDRFNL